jgi:hypothetical protein
LAGIISKCTHTLLISGFLPPPLSICDHQPHVPPLHQNKSFCTDSSVDRSPFSSMPCTMPPQCHSSSLPLSGQPYHVSKHAHTSLSMLVPALTEETHALGQNAARPDTPERCQSRGERARTPSWTCQSTRVCRRLSPPLHA